MLGAAGRAVVSGLVKSASKASAIKAALPATSAAARKLLVRRVRVLFQRARTPFFRPICPRPLKRSVIFIDMYYCHPFFAYTIRFFWHLNPTCCPILLTSHNEKIYISSHLIFCRRCLPADSCNMAVAMFLSLVSLFFSSFFFFPLFFWVFSCFFPLCLLFLFLLPKSCLLTL